MLTWVTWLVRQMLTLELHGLTNEMYGISQSCSFKISFEEDWVFKRSRD